MAFTDYQKAFNSVSHSWKIISLELIGLNKKSYVISFTKNNILGTQYASICSGEDNRNRRYKNAM